MDKKEQMFMRIKLMDKVENVIKHIVTAGASVWSVAIIMDKIEQISYIITGLILLIFGFIIYNIKQKRFIGDKTEQMAHHILQLEQQLDPKRTSSQLTKRGETNPQDK